MTPPHKTPSSPAYIRVKTRRNTPVYRKETTIGRIRFLLGETGYFFGHGVKRLFWSRSGLMVIGSLLFTFMIFVSLIMIYYASFLPEINGLAAAKEQAGVEILAENGEVITRYGQITGDYIAFDKLPPALINAVLATEDRRFFSHHGIDFRGVARAMWVNIRDGRFAQGGSTITQQLAKNVFLTSERTIGRKIQELMMAFWLEQTFSKKEILAIYLNRVYFGAGNYGIDAASRFYFNKPVADMDVLESAMIAGLLKAPSRYNPTANSELAIGRTSQVLHNMVDAELLPAEKAQAIIADLTSGRRKFKQQSLTMNVILPIGYMSNYPNISEKSPKILSSPPL
jgi:penicillin-binding protein 1A